MASFDSIVSLLTRVRNKDGLASHVIALVISHVIETLIPLYRTFRLRERLRGLPL